MKCLELTLASPAENLALDEALLLEAEETDGPETLRFWTSPTPFVVVGIGGKVSEEVHPQACRERGIPVLRRCSGGGTVLQGAGCLNYALILTIPASGPLATIHGANQHIMARNAMALANLTGRSVEVAGHTDLTVNGLKVSGNAQRRLRRHLLFHGTLLLHLDLGLLPALLPLPALQPDYRQGRGHPDFVQNLHVPAEEVKRSLALAWNAHSPRATVPLDRTATLVAERYGTRDWNLRR